MAKIEMTGKAGFGKIVFRANAGIEAKLADLVEKVWENGNFGSWENPNHFYDGNIRYSVMQTMPDHPMIDIARHDGCGLQMVSIDGKFVQTFVEKLREVA